MYLHFLRYLFIINFFAIIEPILGSFKLSKERETMTRAWIHNFFQQSSVLLQSLSKSMHGSNILVKFRVNNNDWWVL